MTAHAGLASGRWWTLTLAEQSGNAGIDVGRALRARQDGDVARFDAAHNRALELLDLTLADQRWRGPRLREIARTREWAAFEVKLGATKGIVDAAAASLIALRGKVNAEPPVALGVITGTGYGTVRPDGVLTIPIGSLGP